MKKEADNMHDPLALFSSQIGRNDPCPCGSGTKYKKCCLPKHEAELQQLVTLQDLPDRYFSAQHYVAVAGYPVTKFDLLLLELLNVIGMELAETQLWSDSRIEGMLDEVMQAGRGFYATCRECENPCLVEPMKRVSFKSLFDKGLVLENIPKALQQQVAINFFYIEFVNELLICLKQQLAGERPETDLDDVTQSAYEHMMTFVDHNCWNDCDNRCLRDRVQSGYCSLCSFSDNKLPCPRRGEITYSELKAGPEDMKRGC